MAYLSDLSNREWQQLYPYPNRMVVLSPIHAERSSRPFAMPFALAVFGGRGLTTCRRGAWSTTISVHGDGTASGPGPTRCPVGPGAQGQSQCGHSQQSNGENHGKGGPRLRCRQVGDGGHHLAVDIQGLLSALAVQPAGRLDGHCSQTWGLVCRRPYLGTWRSSTATGQAPVSIWLGGRERTVG